LGGQIYGLYSTNRAKLVEFYIFDADQNDQLLV